MSEKVAGYCPMGCGETLFLGSGGYVTCSLDVCPRPDAATDILRDAEVHHVVAVDDTGFAVQHPIRERLNGDLFRCSLLLNVARGPRRATGRYRVRTPVMRQPRWTDAVWEAIPDGD